MTDTVRFRRNICGHRFEEAVLDEYVRREARERDQPTAPVRCPECNRTDIRRAGNKR